MQLIVAGFLAFIGVIVFWIALGFGEANAYSGLGPRTFPLIIGCLLFAAGLGLAWQATHGGYKNMEDSAKGEPLDKAAFAWLSFGLIAQMALINFVGFAIATALLFWCCARGLGSRTAIKDAVISVAISLSVYLVFTKGLNVQLTAGLLPF